MTMKKPFEIIVADYSVMVLRVCRAVLDANDAEDAWAETFLSAMRAYPGLPESANVEAWLVTIAHRKSIDVRRSQTRSARFVTPQDRSSTPPAPATVHHDLEDALRSLPTKQRRVVAYHYLGGLPYREVANIVGGTAEAARRAAADGIRNLRTTLANGDEDGRQQ